MQTAVTDYLDEFVVESILAHKGNLRAPRKHLVFLVKWAGYDDPAENTWEPNDNIKDNVVFQDYLCTHSNPRLRAMTKKNYVHSSKRTSYEIEDES